MFNESHRTQIYDPGQDVLYTLLWW